jgi:hypothetical protein
VALAPEDVPVVDAMVTENDTSVDHHSCAKQRARVPQQAHRTDLHPRSCPERFVENPDRVYAGF